MAMKRITPPETKEKFQEEFTDVQVETNGVTITIPPGMNNVTAIEWLQRREAEQNRIVNVNETMKGFPLDCAHALQLAVKERYGFCELKVVPGGFFRPDQPPKFVNIPVDHLGNTTEVFVGRFSVPNISDQSWLQTYPDGFDQLVVNGEVRSKELPEIKALVKLAREKLKTHSLYRGKAVRLEWEVAVSWFDRETEGFGIPTFMPPKPENVQLLVNEETQFLIEASIWAMIRQTDACRKLGIPLKRSALCEGPFGVGKTLLAAMTADIAVENNWTFWYLSDVKHLKEAYSLAAFYGLAVLFSEDIDIAMSGSHADNHAILNVLDGIDTKGAEIMLILTTNYPERLDQAILRPGRLDAVIPFRAPDAATAEKLVRHYAGALLAPGADLTTVGEKLKDRIPAVIREVVERAKLHALADNGSANGLKLDEVALVRSAVGMNHHLEMLDKNTPKRQKNAMEHLGTAFGEEFGKWLMLAVGGASGSLDHETVGFNIPAVAKLLSRNHTALEAAVTQPR